MPTVQILQERLERLEREARQLKETEASLRHSNDIVNSILATSPTGIGLIENRTFIRVNAAMVRLFGYTETEAFEGQSARIIYPSEEDYEKVGEYIYSTLKTGCIAQLDSRFQRRDGSTFYGHLKVNALNPEMPMQRAIATITDVSWRKHAEQERLDREKLQSIVELAGAVCHELNQPIQIAILEYAKLWGFVEDLDLREMKDTAVEMKRQIDRMREITRRLTRITRYSTRDYVSGSQIVDLYEASRSEE